MQNKTNIVILLVSCVSETRLTFTDQQKTEIGLINFNFYVREFEEAKKGRMNWREEHKHLLQQAAITTPECDRHDTKRMVQRN